MNTSRIWITALVAAVMTAVLGVPQGAGAQEQDPPGRIARINYSEGSVSFQPGGEGDWLQAVPNRPLTTGDNLWADRDSRAELHIGSTVLRMSSETSMSFLNLDDRATQLRLAQGSLMLRVRHLDDDDDFEVDTPNLAFTVRRPGEYRVDVNEAGDTTLITVWKGQGEASGGGGSYTVIGGQQSRFTGTDQLDHDIAQIPPDDGFDRWAFERDRREDAAVTPNYISPEMTGYEDLDDYGRWNYVAGYGNVWVPSGVPAGWAPYRYGHWAFIAPWGWTWVEDEPWGFAPFHYGRWAFVESRWCWVPGPVVVRPVYAPAFVAFVGGGGGFHFSLSVGGGPVGWFPLAPGEVYVPPYRVSPEYVNRINVTNTRVNVTQVTNVYNTYITNKNVNVTYVNRNVSNATTVVSRDTFVSARPVDRNLVRVDPKEMAQAPVLHESPAQPVRISTLGAGTPTRTRPPQAVVERRVVATRNPSPQRLPFEQRQAANVKTETPHPAQPAASNENPRMPQENNANRGEVNRPENNPGASRGEPGGNIPRPPEPSARNQNANRGEVRAPANNPAANRGWEAPHPLVRQAPPVQPTRERQQSEENKYRTWQQQRPQPPRPPQPSHSQPARQQPPHGNEKH